MLIPSSRATSSKVVPSLTSNSLPLSVNVTIYRFPRLFYGIELTDFFANTAFYTFVLDDFGNFFLLPDDCVGWAVSEAQTALLAIVGDHLVGEQRLADLCRAVFVL